MINALPEKLDTIISTDGWPLGLEYCLRLKLANIFIGNPSLVVLDQINDLIPTAVMDKYLQALVDNHETAVLYFTDRTDLISFSREITSLQNIDRKVSDNE